MLSAAVETAASRVKQQRRRLAGWVVRVLRFRGSSCLSWLSVAAACSPMQSSVESRPGRRGRARRPARRGYATVLAWASALGWRRTRLPLRLRPRIRQTHSAHSS